MYMSDTAAPKFASFDDNLIIYKYITETGKKYNFIHCEILKRETM